ncbi:uncharacterized protein LOC125493829 [Beta vulgaris subsp. vulgaris]|uniref:uncharacterized protein LOC125493829 n=1 Tax=Beta vulgaris subsp. vulgaris TaxID=3555 RepID=UPI00203724B6|nr:uncharacterized protein LOC125493829 [Beta vulgaris subsp. vulgaris]
MVHFIWRACKGSLGVQERLFHRHIRDSPNCPICGEHQETICHAIFDCTQARAIWQVSAFSAFIAEVPRSFFDGSFEWLVNKVSRDELSVVCALMWAIWFCRNTFIFDSQTLGGVEVASVSTNAEWGPKPDELDSPAAGWLKVNFDAHLSDNGEIGMGAVMRDSSGVVKFAATKRVGARWDATLAEAMAARFVVEVTLRLGYDHVIFEGDALVVVQAVKNNVDGMAPLFRVFYDIRRFIQNFVAFSFLHVKRAGNVVAHLLARWDCSRNSEIVWLDNFPQSITTLVDIDLI